MIVRYACDQCQRFWATDAELKEHRCVNVAAVLEAADRVAQADPKVEHWANASHGAVSCWACSPSWDGIVGETNDRHAADCPHQALVTAMRGEKVTACSS